MKPYFLRSITPSIVAPDHTVSSASVDVCVIGGGFAGLSTALHVAEAGLSVVLLEAHKLGCGATGRSAGQIISGFLPSPTDMVRALGPQHAIGLQHLAHVGKELLKERIQTSAIQCDYKAGYLFVALNSSQAAVLAAMADFWKSELGIADARVLSAEQTYQHVCSSLFCAGLFDPTGGSLDPIKVLHGLMRETSSRGGQLFENTAVQNVKPMSGDRARVETSISSVMARHVVICGGPCLDEIYPAARRVTLPITVGALATEQLSDAVLDQMLPSRLAGSDWRLNADFWSVTADNRLLFGGGARHLRSRSRDPRPALAKRMARVFPALEGAKIDYWWDGQVDVTRSFLPQIGRLDGNVWIARGFNGVGLALGYLAGKMIADAIAGKDNAIDLFAQIPHQLFPGGRMELPTRIWMAMSTWARDLL